MKQLSLTDNFSRFPSVRNPISISRH